MNPFEGEIAELTILKQARRDLESSNEKSLKSSKAAYFLFFRNVSLKIEVKGEKLDLVIFTPTSSDHRDLIQTFFVMKSFVLIYKNGK